MGRLFARPSLAFYQRACGCFKWYRWASSWIDIEPTLAAQIFSLAACVLLRGVSTPGPVHPVLGTH